jgi:Ca2+-binding RTX toxin-like protein
MTTIVGTPADDILNGTNKADIIYGLAGNDTIHGGQGDDFVIGEQDSLSYSNIVGVVTIPPAVSFGADNLFGDQGNDTLIGDLVNLSFVVQSGLNAGQTFGGASVTTPLTVTFGGDTLDGGVGNDVLVGDVDSILLHAQSGDGINPNAVTASSDAILQNIKMTMGADSLYGGEGNDYLYGDVHLMTMESLAGIVTGTGLSASTRMRGITFEGGSDHLYGGNGDDVMVGDIGTLDMHSISGQVLGAESVSVARMNTQGAQVNSFTMGADDLHGEAGNDTLVGDINNLNLTVQSGLASGTDANNQAQFINDSFTMGADSLDGGNGNDNLVGDIGNLSIVGISGDAVNTGFTSADFIRPFLTSGADQLVGGNGDDTLWGDIVNFSVIGESHTVGGSANESFGVFGGSYVMGADTLLGGLGNDVLYGDIGVFTYKMTGGHIDSSSTDVTAGSDAGSFSGGAPGNFSFNLSMGSDMLSGDAGDDVLYGDVGTLNLFLIAGTNEGASTNTGAVYGYFWDSNLIMGDDTLDGGSGNDHLYGDLGTFSAILTSGTGIGSIPEINNTIIKFGSDTLIGGLGDDVLVGDIADPSQLAVFLNAPLSDFPGFPAIANQVIFGNDTFVFSLGGANGNDTILDMNVGATSTPTCTVTNTQDTLKFTDVTDVNHDNVIDFHDVDAASTFSANGSGQLVQSFAGGSVTYANIAYAGQHSVLDITPHVVVVPHV